jgi:hypothetical protein
MMFYDIAHKLRVLWKMLKPAFIHYWGSTICYPRSVRFV